MAQHGRRDHATDTQAPVTTSIHEAREALGFRLRDLRKDAALTGRQLADRAGWPNSKVSKIEYARQVPTETDIRVWCTQCHAEDELVDLIATVRGIEAMNVESRRMLRPGNRRRRTASTRIETETKLFRWYEPSLVPGILHTADYAAAILARVIDFYGIRDDLDTGVAARMEGQQILYRGEQRFHLIMAEQALHTLVGDTGVMIGQLDRLLTVQSLPRVSLGIVPLRSPCHVATNQFVIFDDRLVQVETVSAELTLSRPREIALYAKAFQELSEAAVSGEAARDLIATALAALRDT